AIDAVLIGLLAVGTIAGLVRGLVRQVIELAGIVGALIVAVLFAAGLATVMHEHLSFPYSPGLVVAFLAIFLGCMIAIQFVAASIQKLVRMTFLGWVDRFCGAALGLIVGMIVGSLLVTVALELPIPDDTRREIESSEVCIFLRPIAPWIFDTVFNHGENGLAYERIFKRGGPI
ncbi:MAG: CvpA family protein, partial [Candidatus Krumholzibacteria bacterium]|nr:CvpA family protein [Candidatus Krumholzibacteria bacterium]